MPDPLPLEHLDHVALTTRDVAASRRFYREVLGFREISRPNFDFDGAWLHNYGLTIHIIHNTATPTPQGEIQTRDNHMALHSNDLAHVERLLTEHGIAYRKNLIADRDIRQLFFRDPDGHHIEVGTYPPRPEYIE